MVQYHTEKILTELKTELGEKPRYEEMFSFLIVKIAELSSEVYKPNSIKFITEDDNGV